MPQARHVVAFEYLIISPIRLVLVTHVQEPSRPRRPIIVIFIHVVLVVLVVLLLALKLAGHVAFYTLHSCHEVLEVGPNVFRRVRKEVLDFLFSLGAFGGAEVDVGLVRGFVRAQYHPFKLLKHSFLGLSTAEVSTVRGLREQ